MRSEGWRVSRPTRRVIISAITRSTRLGDVITASWATFQAAWIDRARARQLTDFAESQSVEVWRGRRGGRGAMPEPTAYTSDEMMTVAAARMIRNGVTLFVGIGLPSAAANLARLDACARYGVDLRIRVPLARSPRYCPLSIGDGELSETADAVVSIPEIFSYWLQGGPHRSRIPRRCPDRQVRQHQQHRDRLDYNKPKVRLPGSGRRPGNRWHSCGEVLITLRQNNRAFVKKLDFRNVRRLFRRRATAVQETAIARERTHQRDHPTWAFW